MKLSLRLTLLATMGLMGATIATTDTASADTYTNYNGQATTQTYNYNYANSTTTNQTDATSGVVSYAKKLANMNIPYVWGGASLSGMDCSGLTAYVYQHAAGINLAHNTVAQESQVTYKSVSQAQPGDLLFWGSKGASYHVAIYIGNNQYVAAPQPGQNVEVETINAAFMPSFAGQVK